MLTEDIRYRTVQMLALSVAPRPWDLSLILGVYQVLTSQCLMGQHIWDPHIGGALRAELA
jgi:hypothetical protein